MPRRSERRVIVDTNCWISFLIGKRLSSLVDLLSNERVRLVVCDELLEEIREVTKRRKFAKYFPNIVREIGYGGTGTLSGHRRSGLVSPPCS